MANIPGTNVPAITWGLAGPVVPTGTQVLAGVRQDYDVAFNVTFNFTNESTPQSQLTATQGAVINNAYQFWAWLVTQVDPAYAQGRMQDAIARINFLDRNPPEPTVLQILCIGSQGVILPAGPLTFATIVDPAGNVYQATQTVEIPAGEQIVVPFAAILPGPTPVPASVKIQNAIPGWDTVGVQSGVVGQFAETSQQFELRRGLSVAKNAIGTNDAILGEVLAVPGVLDAYVTDNPSNGPVTVGGVTIATRSIYVCVAGGAAADIAAAILVKKPPGIPMTGTTTVVVHNTNPAYSPPYPSYNVSFQYATALLVYYAVNIANSPQVPADAATQVQNAIINAFNGTTPNPASNAPAPPRARIASNIYANQYAAAVAGLGSWAAVKTLTVGSSNTAGAVFEGWIAGTVLTVTRIISGAVAVGQWLQGGDSVGNIGAGTRVTSFGTGGGGTGTYNLGTSQTIGGATFTATRTALNKLTVTAVTGVIGITDIPVGLGIPVGTTLTGQDSGTPGGAGVYTTSVDTTASAAAVTCSVNANGASADQTFVSVGLSQEPQIAAPQISVVVT